MYWSGTRNVITNLLTFSMVYVSNILSLAKDVDLIPKDWLTWQIYKKLISKARRGTMIEAWMALLKVWSRVKRTFSLEDRKSFSDEVVQELFLEVWVEFQLAEMGQGHIMDVGKDTEKVQGWERWGMTE